MKGLSSSVLILSILTIISCRYELGDDVFTKLSDRPRTSVTIDLLDAPDTIIVMGPTTVHYSVTIAPPGEFLVVMGYNNSPIIILGRSLDGSFTVPNDLNAQYATLHFGIVTTTATGSLADRAFRELLLFSVSKTLRYENSPPVKLNFEIAKKQDGTIFLKWPTYPKVNLDALAIVKTWKTRPGSQSQELVVKLNNKSDLTYTDDTFLGSEIQYRLRTTNNWGFHAYSDPAILTGKPGVIQGVEVKGNRAVVKWTKAELYSNLLAYEVSHAGETITKTEPADTVAELTNIPFGDKTRVVLKNLSKSSAFTTADTTYILVGVNNPGITRIIDDPKNDRTFFLRPSQITKEEDGQSFTQNVPFSMNSPIYLSRDGQFLYLSSSQTIFEIETATFTLVKTYTISGMSQPGTFTIRSFVSIGNFFYIQRLKGVATTILTFDKTANTVIHESTPFSSGSGNRVVTSPDDQYLVESGPIVRVYLIQSDGKTQQQSTPAATADYARFTNNNEVILTSKVGSAWTARTYQFPGLTNGNDPVSVSPNGHVLDEYNGWIGQVNNNNSRFEVIDIETRTVKAQIPLVSTLSTSDKSTIYFNGRWVYLNNFLFKYE